MGLSVYLHGRPCLSQNDLLVYLPYSLVVSLPGSVLSLILNFQLCVSVVISCLAFSLLFGIVIYAIVDSNQDPVFVVAKDRYDFHGKYFHSFRACVVECSRS